MGHQPHRHLTANPRPSWPSPRREPVIAVVGGSLTGPVAALLLLQAGLTRIALYEAVQAPAPQGGGLISLENAALDIPSTTCHPSRPPSSAPPRPAPRCR
ncbi:MAG: hypothetical protein QOJ50_1898 [Cryptosporangiaceae bacterium]|jgi:hypothetical protein|nr:hypothetical protein [Cryptosporangiaceae bacterium]